MITPPAICTPLSIPNAAMELSFSNSFSILEDDEELLSNLYFLKAPKFVWKKLMSYFDPTTQALNTSP